MPSCSVWPRRAPAREAEARLLAVIERCRFEAPLLHDVQARLVEVLSGMLLLALILWNMLVIGHILRHTFAINLGLGVGVAVLYTVASYWIISLLFSTA